MHHAGLTAVLEAVQELPIGHALVHGANGAAGQEGAQQWLLHLQPELTQHLHKVVKAHLHHSNTTVVGDVIRAGRFPRDGLDSVSICNCVCG